MSAENLNLTTEEAERHLAEMYSLQSADVLLDQKEAKSIIRILMKAKQVSGEKTLIICDHLDPSEKLEGLTDKVSNLFNSWNDSGQKRYLRISPSDAAILGGLCENKHQDFNVKASDRRRVSMFVNYYEAIRNKL